MRLTRFADGGLALARPGGRCRITPNCRLKGVLGAATRALMAKLDADSVADVALTPELFGLQPAAI